jgi:hypothetical protein
MNKAITRARNQVRNALGIRKRRRLPPRGQQPVPGSLVINGDLRMPVLTGMSPHLWRWLSNLGWREAVYKNDRRSYDDVPTAWVIALYEASAEERAERLASAAAAARGHHPCPTVLFQSTGWNAPELSYLSHARRAL